jgi:hypothetical protein
MSNQENTTEYTWMYPKLYIRQQSVKFIVYSIIYSFKYILLLVYYSNLVNLQVH